MTKILAMSDSILFSVLIANYNDGEYLDNAIKSILKQTYGNWEVVVVDDCSNDNSNEVYKKYQNDPRFHFHFNEKNFGCGYSKRKCVELASGQLCGFLDADDELLPDAIEIMVQTHRRRKDVSLVFSRYNLCDERMKKKSKSRRLLIPDGKDYFTGHDCGCEHFASFKMESYVKTDGISPFLQRSVDQDLYFRLEEVAPILALQNITYNYRVRTDSVCHTNLYSSAIWNAFVRYETCIRRGLPIEKYAVQTLESDIKDNYKEIQRIRSGWTFRIGLLFTGPLLFIKEKIKNRQ